MTDALVRLQFLLQAKDDRGVIDLIEALQAATNVALELDSRVLPKFITLPRRRRRRRATTAISREAAIEAVAASIREESRLENLLAEEQTQYSNAATSSSIL